MTLLTDFTDHRQCDDLDAVVDGCDCGARMARRADEDNALAFDD